jgi:hypothetical protein
MIVRGGADGRFAWIPPSASRRSNANRPSAQARPGSAVRRTFPKIIFSPRSIPMNILPGSFRIRESDRRRPIHQTDNDS